MVPRDNPRGDIPCTSQAPVRTFSADLKSATIFISVLGSDTQKTTAAQRLKAKWSRVQFQLGRDVTLKYTPKIKFILHDSIEEGDRVLSILDELEQEVQPRDP